MKDQDLCNLLNRHQGPVGQVEVCREAAERIAALSPEMNRAQPLALTDEQIIHIWEECVSWPTEKHPLTKCDIIEFTREILSTEKTADTVLLTRTDLAKLTDQAFEQGRVQGRDEVSSQPQEAKAVAGDLSPLAEFCYAMDDAANELKYAAAAESLKQAVRTLIDAESQEPAQPDAYPIGEVVGACICGSWPGGECLKCPRIAPQEPALDHTQHVSNDCVECLRMERDAAIAKSQEPAQAGKVEAVDEVIGYVSGTNEHPSGKTIVWHVDPMSFPIGTKFHIPPSADAVRNAALEGEIARLNAIINQPMNDDFLRGVSIEAEHQRQKWGDPHDRSKSAENWFWLVGYLAGKCLRACITGDKDKAQHHTISSAAALFNWHKAISRDESGAGIGADVDIKPRSDGGHEGENALQSQPSSAGGGE